MYVCLCVGLGGWVGHVGLGAFTYASGLWWAVSKIKKKNTHDVHAKMHNFSKHCIVYIEPTHNGVSVIVV